MTAFTEAERRPAVAVFTEAELAYLGSGRRLGRLETVGPDGIPHVTPVGWSLSADARAIGVDGRDLASTKKFRDVARTGRGGDRGRRRQAALAPTGVEVRGRAEAVESPTALIRIHPQRAIAWGVDEAILMRHTARHID